MFRPCPPMPMRTALAGVAALTLGLGCIIAQADEAVFPQKYLGLVGNYHTRSGALLAVERADRGLRLLNYRTGLQSDVAELPNGSFELVNAAAPQKLRFHRGKNGSADSISVASRRGTLNARRALYTTQDVTFSGGDGVHLGGTIWRPVGKGPFPAIVFVHGSGPVTRYQFGEFANFAVDRGYAVLTYDKRGSGVSGGDYHPWVTGLAQLSDDALAGLELMRARADVRPTQAGLFGISNGAWVVVQAAARSEHVGFVVLAVGGGVPVLQEDLFEAEQQARRAGSSEEEVRKLKGILTQLLGAVDPAADAAVTIKQTRALLGEASHYPWYRINHADQAAALPDSQLLGLRISQWHNETSYDPAGDLEHIRCPLLAIMGERDELMPTHENEIGLATHLAIAANPDVSLRVLPNASHWMTEGFVDTDPGVNTYAPGLFDVLGSWLQRLDNAGQTTELHSP